jgi:hypothetical protein
VKWYYLLASLPALKPHFLAQPPMSVASFWDRIRHSAPPLEELIQTVLLERDLANLQEVYHGRRPSCAITIPIEDILRLPKAPTVRDFYLPAPIAKLVDDEKWQPEIWKTYFLYALEVADKYGSIAFRKWLEWELSTKTIFAQNRSQKLAITFSRDLPLFLEYSGQEQERLVQAYTKAPNPLEAEQVLDKGRWEKLSSLCAHYSFDSDEVVVYALQLVMLERWWIISQNEEDIFEVAK